MFNFRIDPKTKMVEMSNSVSEPAQVTSVPNMPLTQTDVSGGLSYGNRVQFSDWLGELERRGRPTKDSESSEESTSTEEATSKDSTNNTSASKGSKTEKPKVSNDNAKGVDISAENEKVIDDFATGEIE